MIIKSQAKSNIKCELDFIEDEETLYLNLYNKRRRLFSWAIIEGFRNKYEYNFFHDPDYDVDDLIKLFDTFEDIKKEIVLFIVDKNIYKDEGERYIDRESSNFVYEHIMKEYDMWR